MVFIFIVTIHFRFKGVSRFLGQPFSSGKRRALSAQNSTRRGLKTGGELKVVS
jgi:hypothetical protein